MSAKRTPKTRRSWLFLPGAEQRRLEGASGLGLIRFLGRLIQEAISKVFLILDKLPVHRARAVRSWLAERKEPIEVFHSPPYSPELNPDGGLNADLTQAVTRKPPAASTNSSAPSSAPCAGSQSCPDETRSSFGHQPFRYAASFKISQARSIKSSS